MVDNCNFGPHKTVHLKNFLLQFPSFITMHIIEKLTTVTIDNYEPDLNLRSSRAVINVLTFNLLSFHNIFQEPMTKVTYRTKCFILLQTCLDSIKLTLYLVCPTAYSLPDRKPLLQHKQLTVLLQIYIINMLNTSMQCLHLMRSDLSNTETDITLLFSISVGSQQ